MDKQPATSSNKLIVVANRLPVTINKTDQGEWNFKKSSGGLVTGLSATGLEFEWVGWLGSEVAENEQQDLAQRLEAEKLVPVYIKEDLAQDFYNGFSNGVLWPLFHYFFEKEANLQNKLWDAYKEVNKMFADLVIARYQPGDTIWVHDYQLMLVPEMLRNALPNAKIGFFLHIPFPSSEIYRTFPHRAEILQGLLGANLIGFHTYDYARHFVHACTRTLASETTANAVYHKERLVKIGVIPIGIDPSVFSKELVKQSTQDHIAEFKKLWEGKKVILGVDRLDYTKGIPHKLRAYERFLELYPEQRNTAVLVQVGVPTREYVKEYQQLICEVNEEVGRINSKFGSLKDGFPIHYINKSVAFDELVALYHVADTMLITPIRDGMNLVSYEYIACQEAKHGVLLLSEFAGAANSLSGSILINPWNVDDVAAGLSSALNMSPEEKKDRFHRNFMVVSKMNTAQKWGQFFLEDLEQAYASNNISRHRLPALLDRDLAVKFSQAKKRVFFLDYDGTLVPIARYPWLARPSSAVIEVLKALTEDANNVVYLISGRDRRDLEQFFQAVPKLGLGAEHGAVIRHPESAEWTALYQDVDLSWMSVVKPVMEYVRNRVPGSDMEEKATSLSFHYRNVEDFYGEWKSKELLINLKSMLADLPTEITKGKKVLEVRHMGINKGGAVKKILGMIENADFIFCVGDDRTDENMFDALKDLPNATTCMVGNPTQFTRAQFRVSNPQQVIKFLQTLVSPPSSSPSPPRGSPKHTSSTFPLRRRGSSNSGWTNTNIVMHSPRNDGTHARNADDLKQENATA